MEVATGNERQTFAGHKGGVVSLTFSADANTLVSGGNDTTLLVWDLTGRGGATGGVLSADDLNARWLDLLGNDAPRAYQAVRTFAASPAAAVGLFRERIKPISPPDEKRIAKFIAELDSDEFSVRKNAATELEKLGDLAAAACRKALSGQPALEVRRRLEALLGKLAAEARQPSAERLRVLRALEVLELARTDEARNLLATLAQGAPGAWLTQEARAGITRITQRRGEPLD
jgi:hypothetical protein